MFQYLIVLLLLNFSYHSIGVPLPTNSPESLANLLTALANNCESGFLSDQIKSQIKYCSDLTSPRGGKQLECLLFYDINMQLCAAVGDSKLAIKEDYSSKIKEEQDVNTLCATANEWVFSNITGYPRYQSSVEKVFKRLLACGKICSLDDLMSDDSNYFCKYYKWGTDMLKQQVIPIQVNLALPPADTVSNENKPVSVSSELQDVQIKSIATSNGVVAKEEVKIDETVKTEATKPETTSENKVSEPSSPASEKSDLKAVVEEPVVNEQADKPAEITDDEVKNEGENRLDTTLTKPRVEPQKFEVDKDIQQLNKELEHKEPVLEMPGQTKVKEPSEAIDDYQDSEEGKDGLGDIQGGDDADDPTIEDVNKVNKLDDVKEEQRETPNMKTIVSGITGESVSGLYPSYGQEGYSDDDDDHFFSFFLTAVIMVVLIYVLYHNKSKVAKVFFGLILEGRQAGRRRNSRGHAYRRLDTLEQAMSTNTAAPPSKIIY